MVANFPFLIEFLSIFLNMETFYKILILVLHENNECLENKFSHIVDNLLLHIQFHIVDQDTCHLFFCSMYCWHNDMFFHIYDQIFLLDILKRKKPTNSSFIIIYPQPD